MLSACSYDRHLFIASTVVDTERWYMDDTAVFEMPASVDEDAEPHIQSLSASVRFTEAYQYGNLSLGVKVYKNDEIKTQLVKTDTLNFDLFKENGDDNGAGSVFLESKQSSLDIEIDPSASYTIKVYHIMRLDPISGITNVMIQVSDKK